MGALDDAGRQRFHEEQMLAAEMCLVPRDLIPPTVPAPARGWPTSRIAASSVTDNARRVAQLFLDPSPRGGMAARAHWSRDSRRGTAPLREMYGFPLGPARQAAVDAAFAVTRAVRRVPAGEVPLPGAARRVATPAEGEVVPTRSLARDGRSGSGSGADRSVRRCRGCCSTSTASSSRGADPGAIEAMVAFRASRLPVCLITNTTTHPRTELAETLNAAGFR